MPTLLPPADQRVVRKVCEVSAMPVRRYDAAELIVSVRILVARATRIRTETTLTDLPPAFRRTRLTSTPLDGVG